MHVRHRSSRLVPALLLAFALVPALLLAGCQDQPLSPEVGPNFVVKCGVIFEDPCFAGGGDGTPTPPDISIDGHPDVSTYRTTATFTFGPADRAFECSLDEAEFESCTSPKEYTDLAAGRHVFAVREAGKSAETFLMFGWTVQSCGPGTYLEAGTACEPAPAGHYVGTGGATEPTPCSEGTYQPETGQSSCIPAPEGRYVAGTGATAATPCDVGTYQPDSGKAGCMDAPAGQYVDTEGATAPIACAVGTYQSETKQSSCEPAPQGSYVDIEGANGYTACPAGTTTSAAGSKSIEACEGPGESGFTFGGFLPPLREGGVNKAKAGSAVPVKFSLGGDRGLAIFAPGYPRSESVACDSADPEGNAAETITAGKSGLSYDPVADQYSYVWKTEKAWVRSCRVLTLELVDGSTHAVTIHFDK